MVLAMIGEISTYNTNSMRNMWPCTKHSISAIVLNGSSIRKLRAMCGNFLLA